MSHFFRTKCSVFPSNVHFTLFSHPDNSEPQTSMLFQWTLAQIFQRCMNYYFMSYVFMCLFSANQFSLEGLKFVHHFFIIFRIFQECGPHLNGKHLLQFGNTVFFSSKLIPHSSNKLSLTRDCWEPGDGSVLHPHCPILLSGKKQHLQQFFFKRVEQRISGLMF